MEESVENGYIREKEESTTENKMRKEDRTHVENCDRTPKCQHQRRGRTRMSVKSKVTT